MTIAYCMKCREKREMINEHIVMMEKTGMKRIAGNCSVCNTKMSKIIGN